MKAIIIIFGLIYLLSCSSVAHKSIHVYTPIKLEVDSSSYKSTITIDTIVLEENYPVFIQDVTWINISKDAEIIALTSIGRGITIVYDYNNGKIISSVKADESLSDTIVKRGIEVNRIMLESIVDKKQLEYTWKHITKSDFDKYGITKDMQKFVTRNTNNNAIFSDDNKLFVASQPYTFIVNDTDNRKIVSHEIILLIFDFTKQSYNTVFFDRERFLSVETVRYLDDNYVYCVVSNDFRAFYNYKDSFDVITKYDFNGNYVETVSYLSEVYEDYNIVYDMLWQPYFSFINDDLITCFPIDDYVYKNNEKYFKLQNLPFSNFEGLELFKNNQKTISELHPTKHQELFDRLLPIKIFNMFVDSDNNLIFIFVVNDPEDQYFLVQKYDFEGNLKSEYKLNNEEDKRIHNFAYDKKNDYLVLAIKTSEIWYLERRKL